MLNKINVFVCFIVLKLYLNIKLQIKIPLDLNSSTEIQNLSLKKEKILDKILRKRVEKTLL